jgi:hypothetical protein
MESRRNAITQDRRSVPAPDRLVDDHGRCAFGTFSNAFRDISLTGAKRPTALPDVFNAFKLTRWESVEVCFREGILLAGCTDMGLFGKMLVLWHDFKSGKIMSFDETFPTAEVEIGRSVCDGSGVSASCRNGKIAFLNDLNHGSCYIHGSSRGRCGTLQYQLGLSQVCEPSVVSIPLGENRPMYSEKMLFHCQGRVIVDGREIRSDDSTAAIIDHHAGYYPRAMHYDWITFMGRTEILGRKQFCGLNLTANQSVDPERFNENLIWMEQGNSLLPPVRFMKDSSSPAEGTEWKICDAYDMVHLNCRIRSVYPMVMHTGIVNIDYYVIYGTAGGYLRTESGETIPLHDIPVIGEDKSLLF